MANAAWGLDLSSTSLKAVRLERGGQGIEMTDARVFSVASDNEEDQGDDSGEVPPRVKEGLAQFTSEFDVSGEQIVVSIPGHTTFNRFIQLPPVEEEQTSEIIEYEARQNIPFDIEEVEWDYHKIERDYEPGEEREVVIMAIKKQIVNRTLGYVKQAGLSPDVLQFSPIALYNLLEHEQISEGTTTVLDIGENGCDLLVVEGHRYWVRNIPMSAADITKALMDETSYDFAQAEEVKKKAGKTGKGQKFAQVFQGVYQELVQEIHRSIGFYKSKSRGAQIDRIYLVGGGANSFNIAEYIQQNMQKPTNVFNSFKNINPGTAIQSGNPGEQIPILAGATGLALQGLGVTENKVNLLPERVLRKKKYRKKWPYIGVAAVLLLVAIYGIYHDLSNKIKSIRFNQVRPASQVLQKYDQKKKKVEEAKKDPHGFEEKLKKVDSWVAPRVIPFRFWRAVQDSVPDNKRIRRQINDLMVPVYRATGDRESLTTISYAEFLKDPPEEYKDVHKQIQEKVTRQLWLLEFQYDLEERQGRLQGSEKEEKKGTIVNKSKLQFDIQGAIAKGEIVRRDSLSQERNFVRSVFAKEICETLGITQDRMQEEGISIDIDGDGEITTDDYVQILFDHEDVGVNRGEDLSSLTMDGGSGGGGGGFDFNGEQDKTIFKYLEFSLELAFPLKAFNEQKKLNIDYVTKTFPLESQGKTNGEEQQTKQGEKKGDGTKKEE